MVYLKIYLLIFILLSGCAVQDDGDTGSGNSGPGSSQTQLTEAEKAALIQNFYDTYQVRCVDNLVSFSGDELPGFPSQKAFGPPLGQGEFAGSLDVFVIGEGNEAIFEVSGFVMANGEGSDFKVFENGFRTLQNMDIYSWDLGTVEVSPDGNDWYGFMPSFDSSPYNEKTSGKDNLVGLNPVILNYQTQSLDPRPVEAGGDAFDLNDAKKILDRGAGNPLDYSYGNSLEEDSVYQIRYIKVIDGGEFFPDEQVVSNGVDIDAICIFNPVSKQ